MLVQFLYHDPVVAVEDSHELFQNLEVERRSEQFAMLLPFCTCNTFSATNVSAHTYMQS